MQSVSFNSELIVVALASFVSVLFKFFPFLNTWYAAKRTEVKSGIMIGLMFLLAGAITLLAKFGILNVEQPITLQSFWFALYFAITSNQFTYLIFPEPVAVKKAKENSVERSAQTR